ncbi:uncharacterized protein LOC133886521 [Phragmites australis]|uniref:uncharacterized protein LOC133886521 n=1 Tax=Phragmites australis TaxID=29695 RepID=UPI002D795AE8|nr:uncharacterized protein LOC133886521 [Phragmites australis]
MAYPFSYILGRYALQSHATNDEPSHDDPDLIRENFIVLMWIYVAISKELLDLVLKQSVTAYGVWLHLQSIFFGNKPNRVIHLEAEHYGLRQGDLSVAAYCHKLQSLATTLADCDQPMFDRALVHQLIRWLNSKFQVLLQMLPTLPTFPTFQQTRDHLIIEDLSQARSSPTTTYSALVANCGNQGSFESSTPCLDRLGSSSDLGHGGCGFWGHGRGVRNNANGPSSTGGRGQQPPQLPYFFNGYTLWGPPPSAYWRAPWTGSTGLGLLGAHPPVQAPAQAFNAYQSQPMPPLDAAPSWDAIGLVRALQAASFGQPSHVGEWFMNTGASSHIPSDSVRKFTADNSCTIEFDKYGFSVKDLVTKQVLLRCNSEHGLYPLLPGAKHSPPVVFTALSTSVDL